MITIVKGSYNKCKKYIEDNQRFHNCKLYLSVWDKKNKVYCVQYI